LKLKEETQPESTTSSRTRVYNIYKCDYCGKEYRKQKRQAENSPQEHYCSKTCYSNANSTSRVLVTCSHCGVNFTKLISSLSNSKSGHYFCCREHKDIAQKYLVEIQPGHYGKVDGHSTYRAKALKHYKPICNRCGFSVLEALEVHHIDRNRANNDITNLMVLCANCHILEHRGL